MVDYLSNLLLSYYWIISWCNECCFFGKCVATDTWQVFLDYWKMIKNSAVLYYWKMQNHTDVFSMIGTWQMLLLFDHWKWSIAVCAIIKKTVNTYCCLVLLENGEWYVSFVYYCSKDNYFVFVWGNRLNSNMIAIYLITVQIAMSLLRWSFRPELLVFSNIICSLCTCALLTII